VRLLLDECIGQRSLAKALALAGHDVMRSVDELGGGVEDDAVFALACGLLELREGRCSGWDHFYV
jgi:hypothetical protein